MALRVTNEDVLNIMDVTASETDKVKIDTMITTANLIINKVFENDTIMSEELLTECEKYLAAHIAALTIFRSTSQEKIGDVTLIFTGKWGDKLNSTPYGQMLLTMDISGKLAATGKEAIEMYAIPNFDY